VSRATLTPTAAKTRLNRLWDAISHCAGRQAAYPDVCEETQGRIAKALRDAPARTRGHLQRFAEISAVLTCPPRELLEFPAHKEPIARFLAFMRVLELEEELNDEVYAALTGWSEGDQTLILNAVTEALRGEA
jgi:hypothetical protein